MTEARLTTNRTRNCRVATLLPGAIAALAMVAADAPPSFVNDVVPVLTRLGCNSGACHGKLAGQNGFKLSLRGYAPEMDHPAITRDARGRRIAKSRPRESLLLTKPLMKVPHKGGHRLIAGSPEYQTLLEWVAAGAPGPVAGEPVTTSRIARRARRERSYTARKRDSSRWPSSAYDLQNGERGRRHAARPLQVERGRARGGRRGGHGDRLAARRDGRHGAVSGAGRRPRRHDPVRPEGRPEGLRRAIELHRRSRDDPAPRAGAGAVARLRRRDVPPAGLARPDRRPARTGGGREGVPGRPRKPLRSARRWSIG